MNCPRISIITASYNSEKYIEKTIQSVINQTYKNIEYIIVDGVSTDNTIKIIDRYRQKINTLISEPDKGIYDAFNKGIAASSGEVIYFLNSDDYLYNEMVIEKVVEVFRSNKEIKIVYGNILVVNERKNYSFINGKKVDLEDFKKGIMPPHPGLFVKKELFNNYGPFDEKYKIAADFDFLTTIFKQYLEQSYYIKEIIAYFRDGGMSTNLSNKKNTREETREIILKHFGECLLNEYSIQDINIIYYKKWIELLLEGKTFSSILQKKGIKSVVIFGTVEMSTYVFEDLKKSGIEVLGFLDNDPKRQDMKIKNLLIYPPTWLKENANKINAIIFAFEGEYEKEISKQIKDELGINNIELISWKEMIELNFRDDLNA